MRSDIHPWRLLVKALLLFVVINIVFAVADPVISRFTLYNSVFPGRVRFPFGDEVGVYTVMVDNLDTMVASHEISRPKAVDEFRVVIIGDSSVWGEGAQPADTISVLWDETGVRCGDKQLKFYNLGYPHPSMVKDLMILDKAMEYEPDMVVWFMTLNTLTPRRLSPFVRANAARAVQVLDTYHIPYNSADVTPANSFEAFYERTILGRRSEIARLIRLQVLGLFWTITGTDGTLSTASIQKSEDVPNDPGYKGFESESELESTMMLNALVAGHDIVNPVPVLLVNEPMFIATGMNSDVRYNDGYPRWVYDYYRNKMAAEAEQNQWHYLDLWNAIPNEYFIDNVLHTSPDGQRLLIQKINPVLQSIACP